MLIPLGYHMSRSASDFSHLWRIIKTCIVSSYRDDEDECRQHSHRSRNQVGQLSEQEHREQQQQLSKRQSTEPSSTAQPTPLAQRAARQAELNSRSNSNEHIELSSLEKHEQQPEQEQELEQEQEHEQELQLEQLHSKSKASSLGSSQTLAKSNKRGLTASSSFASIAVGHDASGAGAAAAAANIAGTVAAAAVKTARSAENLYAATITESKSPTEDTQDDKISSSSTTNPGDMSTLTAGANTANTDIDATDALDPEPGLGNQQAALELDANELENELPDPLPRKLQATVTTRLKNDFVVMTLLAVSVLVLHCSTVFTVLQPDLNVVLYVFIGTLGVLLHYAVPQMRKHMPWLCFARPLLRQKEFGQFEVLNAPQIMWFEKLYIYLSVLERNVLFPLLAISSLTADAQSITDKFGVPWGTLIVAVCALKCKLSALRFLSLPLSSAGSQFPRLCELGSSSSSSQLLLTFFPLLPLQLFAMPTRIRPTNI